MDNATKMVQEQLMEAAKEVALLFIRNNWAYLSDAKGGPLSIENWTLTLINNLDDEKETFKYSSPRKDGWPLKDFTMKFELVTGKLVGLEGVATLTDVAAIMQDLLIFAKEVDQEKGKMPDKPFDEEVTEHRKNEIKKLDNCIADMDLQHILKWLEFHWGRKSGDGEGNFGIINERCNNTFHDEFLEHAREAIFTRLGQLYQHDMTTDPNPVKEEQLLAQLKQMSDKDLAIWFRGFQFHVGPNYIALQNPLGSLINYEVPYWPAFGREIAARLETPRVTDDMLIIDLGKERPINPLTAVKRFTTAIEKIIQEGPEEPDLRAYGTDRQLSQGWIDWYRKTHACGFDVAWKEGARRLINKEYANRPEELKKITWYPRPFNPLYVEIGTKLEFIQQ